MATNPMSEVIQHHRRTVLLRDAAKDLPKAQEVLELLEDYLEWNSPERHGDEIQDHAQEVLGLLEDYLEWNGPERHDEEIQDHFWIERIEPGKLWLKPLTAHPSVIGPVPVPRTGHATLSAHLGHWRGGGESR
jgi:hypothetical protein